MMRFGLACAAWLLLLPLTALAANEGQADLDEATQLKVQAQTFGDLEKVIALCESALSKGLDDGNQKFADQLLVSTLLQRSLKLSEAVLDRQPPDPRWPQLRELAVRDLDKIVERDAAHAEAHFLLARLHALPGGNRERALKALDALAPLHKEDAEAAARDLVLRGDLQEKPEDRLANYEAAIKLHAKCLEAYRGRARVYLGQKKTAEASADFAKVLELQPDDVASLEGMVEILAAQEKYDAAIEFANQIIKALPENSATYVLRARLHSLRREPDKALADLNEAIRLDDDNLLALLTRTALHLSRNDLDLARADAERSVQAAARLPLPAQMQSLLMRANVAAAAKRYDEAIADIMRLLEADSDNESLRLRLAMLEGSNGRLSRGLSIINALLAKDPENAAALRSRADLYLNSGKHAEAIADYERAMKASPDDEGILNNLAWVLCTSPDDKLRSAERAVELAKKAVEVTKEKQAHIMSTLAAAFAEQKNFAEAVKWSSKAVEMSESEIREQLEQELASYKQQKPWRELKEVEQKPEPPGANSGDLDFK